MSASLALFDKEHNAREKYVYFICSVAGALVAYLGKDFKPNYPWTTHDALAMWTLGSLIASFVCGLIRILLYIEGMSINRDVVVSEEELAVLTKSLAFHIENEKKGTPVSISNKTGEKRSTENTQDRINELISLNKKNTPRMKKWHYWSTGFLVICHVFLVAGFILLLCSKLFYN